MPHQKTKKKEINMRMKLQSDYVCLLKLPSVFLQEILRREGRNLLCLGWAITFRCSSWQQSWG